MSLFGWLARRGSAPAARDRLKVLLAHERTLGANSELLGVLREDILAVICRHLTIAPEHIQVNMSRRESVSTLAIDIEIPSRP